MRVHPQHLLGDDELAVLDAWEEWRGRPTIMATLGGVMEIPGPRIMPFSGGLYDQAACIMDAFRIMDQAAAALPAGDGGEY